MKSDVPLLDRIMYYIVQRKGKQVRPMFVLLSAKMFGNVGDSAYHAAALVELLHTATLVHDDVVDDAYLRRGFFSINALWKNKIAVLVGDYLLSRGLLLAIDNEEYQLLQIVSRAVKEMSEGELLQIEKARRLDIREDVYYEIIRQKTASLIAAACSAGTASALEDPDTIERMRLFGENIGMAFQIKDDLLDYGTNDIGKPTAIDIKEKKMTLPLIYALQHASRTEKRRQMQTLRSYNTDKARVNELLDFVRAGGGIEYARQKMVNYREEALSILESMPENNAREALRELIAYVVDREY
jgi:octaprenyl-diphosphate synthase